MAEKPAVVCLNGEEVQHAILYKIGESFEKTCHLTQATAYTSFRAKIRIEIMLDDYGRLQPDNHIVEVSAGVLSENAQTIATEIDIEPQAPNIVRRETGQEVPVEVVKDGKKVRKYVRYQRAKKTEPAN